MGRSRWALPFALPLTFCILGVHPAAGVPGTKAGLLPAPGVRGGPATPGEQLWAKRYNDSSRKDDTAYAVGVSPDGSKVFVTGASRRWTGFLDYATVAYDSSTGAQLWVRRYDGPNGRDDIATELGVSPDGSKVFVAGRSGSRADYATVAYDASTGAQLWVGRYNGPVGNGDDVPYALGVSPDGSKVLVTGFSLGVTSGYDYATVAYNAADGTELWVERYNGTGNNYDYAFALGVSPDGSRVFVTGASPDPTGFEDWATVAYSASDGTELWVRRYTGLANSNNFAQALGVSPDGSTLFVTGYGDGAMTFFDYVTAAYSASTGDKLWVRRYNGPGNVDDSAYSLGVSPDGSRVFVTGTSGSVASDDYATVAYDGSSGAKLWLRRYNGPGNGQDQAFALGVSPDGSTVFVTGYSLGSGMNVDYATVAYNASTGGGIWVTSYNGPANGTDEAFALAVSPTGSAVFVTGFSFGSGTNYDYATVAYSTT